MPKTKVNGRIATIGDLTPDPRNIKKHSAYNLKTIEDSLHEVGAARSIVIDENNTILAGNGLVEAAVLAGIENVKVIDADGETIIAVRRTGLTDKQKKRLAFYDNYSADTSQRDYDSDLLRALADEDDQIKRLLQQDDELAKLLAGEPQAETADADDLLDRSDEINEKWKCASGDVWAVEDSRLFCLDSEKEFAGRITGLDAKIVFTDPPYGINVVGNLSASNGGGKPITIGTLRQRAKYPFGGKKNMAIRGTVGTANWVDATSYKPVHGDDKPFDPTWLLSLAPHAIIWGGNYFASKLSDSRCWLVWDKNNTGHFADCELAWTNLEKSVRIYRHTWNGLVREGSRTIEGKKRLHPTQKPATLLASIVRDFTDEGDFILDPYSGSGSTFVAALLSGRNCYAAEIEPSYIAVTLERLSLLGLAPRLLTAET